MLPIPEFAQAVYVPLVARNESAGIMIIADNGQRQLSEIDLLEILAANLGVALENAHLYQNAMETAEQLKEIDRLKSQFLANMSHELRTPLNSIIGFSRVILKGIDGPLTEMQHTDLQAVFDSGQHLLGLINDILDISKIQAGKMELAFEPTDLREIIRGVMSTAVALVKNTPIELRQNLPDDLPIVRADPRRIRQVLLNLVGNAAKFTEAGHIEVSAAATASEVLVTVSDTGIGIPEDKLEGIFEEFSQVDGSSTRRAGGSGLGLSISRHFLEMHGGRIWVESAVGLGSVFSFALPTDGPDPDGAIQTGVESRPQAVEDEETPILCVDDDQGVILLFERYLSQLGYRVVGLTDSAAVVETARRIRPFAIILDVLLPHQDGWSVISDLKSNPETHDIPVIICSIINERDRGLSLGAVDYLQKPILEEDLISVLQRLEVTDGDHRILIVDDSSRDRDLVRRFLRSQGHYDVTEAKSGEEALASINDFPPDLIILDLMMPDVDGFAVIEWLRSSELTRSIPTIIVTAKELTVEESEALSSKTTVLLQKGSFHQQKLLAAVGAALRRPDKEPQ